MSKLKALFKNEYIFSVLTKIGTMLIGMAYSIVFARFVGAELKGSLAYIHSIVATGSIVLSFGIHHAYPYYRKNADNVIEYNKRFVSTSCFLYVIYLILGVIVFLFFQSNEIVSASVFLMVLWSYNRVQGYVVLIETPNKRNKSIMVFSVVELCLAIGLFLFTKANFYTGLLCMSCLEICKFLYFTLELKGFISAKYISPRHAVEIVKYGILPMLALLMTTLNYRIDVIMLKNTSNILIAEVGVYSIGIALTEKVLLIPDAIQEILLSRLAKHRGASEVAAVTRITLPVCLAVAAAIAVLGKPFLDFFYGREYQGAYAVTCISITGTLWMVFFKMISQFNIVNRHQGRNVILLSVAIITNVVLNLIFVPIWRINGAAFATSVGNALCAALFVIDFSKESRIPIRNIVFIQKRDIQKVLKLR